MHIKQALFVLAAVVSTPALGQTILFDFETGRQGWGSFGAITTDSGELPFDGSVGQGRYHAGDFSEPDTGNFGIVDVSPVGQNLSAFGGLSVDARFVDVPGFPAFEGVKELDIIVAKNPGPNEEEFIAPKVTMTEEYQTFSVFFKDFRSELTTLAPTTADLTSVQIKLRVLNVNGVGVARFDYDQVTGLAPVAADDPDFDGDGDVDGSDFLTWQRNVGTGSTQQAGDANNTGTVDGADLAVWRSQFGPAAAAAVAAIPEPTSVALTVLAAAALLSMRGRRRALDMDKVISA